MTIEQDFLPFATGGGANVVSQAAYAGLAALSTGYQAGVAASNQLNKTWRQSSIMSAVLAQFIVNQTGQPAIDDGTTATLLTNLATAVAVSARQNPVLTDTGAANAYVVANLSAFSAYPTVSGLIIDVSIANANTGASTLNVDGLGTKPILGLALQPLQGGELIVKGVACLMYVVASTVNGGNGAWIVMECTGGAQQVAPATQSAHALQAGQALGLFLGAQTFASSGTYTPGVYVVGGRSVTATRAKFRLVGGGGGGGGVNAPNSAQAAAACGGNGGEYKEYIVTSGLASQTITIGGAGAGGAAGFNVGSQGGTTSVGALVSAVGGLGGAAGGAGAPPYVNTGQANNGGGSTSGPLVVWRGCELGAPGLAAALAFVLGGQGGNSPFGAGGKGGGSPSAGAYGAGGGGAAQGASGAAVGGSAGIGGYVLVEEYA